MKVLSQLQKRVSLYYVRSKKSINEELCKANNCTLRMWGISFTDFRASRSESINSSEARKNDILTLLTTTSFIQSSSLQFTKTYIISTQIMVLFITHPYKRSRVIVYH